MEPWNLRCFWNSCGFISRSPPRMPPLFSECFGAFEKDGYEDGSSSSSIREGYSESCGVKMGADPSFNCRCTIFGFSDLCVMSSYML
mmetsp:Transcript_31980/g.51631  ORF Transcript_31980/g.51631 Transcript_31980/m.51631 type:complete len:87 (+) Transcript_31980:1285-1545(+)